MRPIIPPPLVAFLVALFLGFTGFAARAQTSAGPTAITATPPWSIRLLSEPGELLGKGATYDLSDATGQLTVAGTASGGWIRFAYDDSSHHFDFWFAGPKQAPLQVDAYSNVSEVVNDDGLLGALYVAIDHQGGSASGNFRVKSISYDAEGQLTAFWATFENHVYDEEPALLGEIRFHAGSGPYTFNKAPVVTTGETARVILPDPLLLSGTATDDGLPQHVLETEWHKVRGPGPVSIANLNALQTTATFSVPGTYLLRLTAVDGDYEKDGDLTVTVIDPKRHTSLDLAGQNGETTVGPDTIHLNQLTGDFNVRYDDHLSVHYVDVDSGNLDWDLDFYPAQGQPLQSGSRFPANPFTAGDPYSGSFSIANGAGAYASEPAGFDILKLIRGPDGSVISLWAVFTAYDSTELRGEIKYNAELIAPGEKARPCVSAGVSALGRQYERIVLHGVAGDEARPGFVPELNWSVVRGPGKVAFDNPHAATTAARFSKGGDYILKLTATEGALSRSSLARVRVQPQNTPTRVRIVKEPGSNSYTDEGATYAFDPLNSGIYVSGNSYNGVSATIYNLNGDDVFSLEFGGPNFARLAPGEYRNASSNPGEIGVGSPALTLFGPDLFPVDSEHGRFSVKQIRYDEDGNIVSCWITFVVHEIGNPASVRGELRYNATDTPEDPPTLQAKVSPTDIVVPFNGRPLTLQAETFRGGLPTQDGLVPRWYVAGDLNIFSNNRAFTTTAEFPAPGLYTLFFQASSFVDSAAAAVRVLVVDQPSVPQRDFYAATLHDASGAPAGVIEIRVAGEGAYSARITFRGKRYALHGVLGDGWIAVPGLENGSIAFDVGGALDFLTLKVGAARFTAELQPAGTGIPDTAPGYLLGKHVLATAGDISPDLGDTLPSDTMPLGRPWGVLTLSGQGRIRWALRLPDATSVVLTSQLMPNGSFVVEHTSPDGRSVLAGDMSFEVLDTGNLNGSLEWRRIRPARPNLPALNLTTAFAFQFSPLLHFAPDQEPLTGVRAGDGAEMSTLEIDGLSADPVYVQLLLEGRQGRMDTDGFVFPYPSDTSAVLKSTTSGIFTGTFLDPATLQPIRFEGIVLGSQQAGFGFFQSGQQSGAVKLHVFGQ